MRSLVRLRQSLTVVAVMVLAACNAAQSVSPNVGAGSNSRLEPTRVVFDVGRRFAATYSGSFIKDGDCSATAMFTYEGGGNATFLHSSREQIKFTWFCGTHKMTGSATLTSLQVPRDSISANVSSSDFTGPCESYTMSFTVTGGTGRFRHASGSGTIVLHRPTSKCPDYSYSDKWRGTLKF